MTKKTNGEEPEEKEDMEEIIKENNRLLNELLKKEGIKEGKMKKLGKSQRKKGYVRYIYIRTNGDIVDLKVPAEEMTTFYEKTPRIASPEYILNYKNTPTIIQPEWSVKPFSMVDNWKETVKTDTLAAGYKLLALRAEQGNIKPKKKLSGTMIFFIIVALLVVAYLLFF